MLRFTVLATLGATGVSLTVAHGLGQAPNIVILTPFTNANGVEVYVLGVTAAVVRLVNSTNSVANAQLTALVWQGRLY